MTKFSNMGEKVTKTVVDNYQKIENKFSEKFLEEDGSLKIGKIGESVTEGFQKIENGVVSGYKKTESGVVDGFEKVSDKFVEKLFTKEGETVQETKERLTSKKES